ncbi:hypothetical protein DXG01_000915 [Tephrocybe rancida]|nr:hypothetical protein DXG01_000915 [Tephrocybe rancida]
MDPVCVLCNKQLLKGKLPKNALANGLWVGDIPEALQDLTFAECLMIARVYQHLPPSQEELDEVLAFVFIGSAQPTEEDFEHTPMFVRRNKVAEALEWLKLNHADYTDLEISQENMDTYTLRGVPVHVDYKQRPSDQSGVKLVSASSVHDNMEDEGTDSGPCPFIVHGLTGNEYVGQKHHKKIMSEAAHKRHLLMCADKRFQTDIYFPIIAFNHDQMKSATSGSFLLAKHSKFDEISNHLLSLDTEVLKQVKEQLEAGEHVKKDTPEKKACFDILDDLDAIRGRVKGSITSKKFMRNEVWSLLSFAGAPSWFGSQERYQLISRNPVAAARFFHLLVKSFIKNVLGVGADHPGLYGDTSAYYGAVEQQGRLTLHMQCQDNKNWWEQYIETTDDLVSKSNVHNECRPMQAKPEDPSTSGKKDTSKKPVLRGCQDANGNCKAQFPRATYEETIVNEMDGYIDMKKREPMVNFFTPPLTYLMRSNTDTTSPLSGTSI